jgi:hypothetical protein
MATATNDDTLKMLGVAATGAGIGMMIGAALAGVDRRAEFTRQVSTHLAGSGVKLLGSDLGRDASRAVWILSVGLPQGTFMTLNAPVVGDAFAPNTAHAVASAVLDYLRRHQLLVA